MAEALNDRFSAVVEKAMGSLVGQMTGKMEVRIKEMRKATQKQLDEAEAKIAGMQAALLMAQAVINKAIGAAPRNGAPKSHGGRRPGSGGSPGGSGLKVNEKQKQEMMRIYRETRMPLREIGEKFGISSSYVYMIARARGLVYSRKGWPNRLDNSRRQSMALPASERPAGRTEITPEIEKRIWDLHEGGMPNRRIAKELGIGHTAVNRRINAHRTPTRRRPTPAQLARFREAGRLGGLKRAQNMRKAQEAKTEPAAEG